MRSFGVVIVAILAASVICQLTPSSNRCPDNVSGAIREIKKILNKPKVPWSERFELHETLSRLIKECLEDVEGSKIPVLGASKGLGATPAECKLWRERAEFLAKLIQNPSTRTDRVLGEHAETLNRISKQC